MATSNDTDGDVTMWDLNSGGRITGILRGAHNPPAKNKVGGGISKIDFLPGQPILITSGLDNSLKTWAFDESPFSSIPRLLHSREGHAGLVTRLKFLPSDADGADASGKWLMSSGTDRSLWGWSLRRDGQSAEMSQGNIRKKAKKMGLLGSTYGHKEQNTSLDDLKAPEISCIAVSLNRDGGIGAAPGASTVWSSANSTSRKGPDATVLAATGWESVVTGHKGDGFARTWFFGRKRAGRWMFPTSDSGSVTSVAISPCGTFAIVGSSNGAIDMFNLQSGHHRQRFPKKLTPAQAKRYTEKAHQPIVLNDPPRGQFAVGTGKHQAPVTGLTVDSMNQTLISCSLDGKLKVTNQSSLLCLLLTLQSSSSGTLQMAASLMSLNGPLQRSYSFNINHQVI
jgi:U3 small nucleolar RNA-associated protein 21